VLSVAFAPDGKTLASASEDMTVRLWDVARGSPLAELKGHSDEVWSVAFSPDSKTLASSSYDQTVRLWDVAKREQKGAALKSRSGNDFRSVVFSPDGKMLALASSDQTIQLWSVATGQPLDPPFDGHSEIVWSAVFSPDGSMLASASADSSVRLWDVASRMPIGDPLLGHAGEVVGLAFSPDGKTLASAGLAEKAEDRKVWLWDVDAKSWAARLCPRASRNLSEPYRRLCPALPAGEGAAGK
jgi:WD40 repeat protein